MQRAARRAELLAAAREVDGVVACPVRRRSFFAPRTSPPSRSWVRWYDTKLCRSIDELRQLGDGPVTAHELLQQSPTHRVCRKPQDRRRFRCHVATVPVAAD